MSPARLEVRMDSLLPFLKGASGRQGKAKTICTRRAIRAPGTRFCCFFAQGSCLSISTLIVNLSRAMLGRGSNKPESRHRGSSLLLWTAGHSLIKPMSCHAIRSEDSAEAFTAA
jgi:hypothetical protein